jgi:hypothetical protein
MRFYISFILFLSSVFLLAAQEPEVVLDSTSLPLFIINTNGGTIVDEPKIMTDLKIIFNGPNSYNKPGDLGNIYTGTAGIEYRGSFSQVLPQKPYGFETWDAVGNNLNVPLLDMPAENDWILLANYNDKVFMRNTLAFHLFEKMGHYAPRAKLCEVIVNDEYMGIFVFTEKIKRDKNRLNIARLDIDDNAGDSLSGGYMFAVDYNYDETNSWTSNFKPIDRPDDFVHFVYKYPESDVITFQQNNYLKTFVNVLESKLYGSNFRDPFGGYRAYLDINSFIDYFIIGELSRNVDAYKKSCFYYKDRDDRDGLLHAGPVWDFDWAWKNLEDNCSIFDATDGSAWAYRVNECNNFPVAPSWVKRLLQDQVFREELLSRYTTLRQTILSNEYLNHYIDSVNNLVSVAQERHYTKWPILGVNVGAPEVDPPAETFGGEIEKFRNWITLRLTWLDSNMPPMETTDINEVRSEEIALRLFPNPVHEVLHIESMQKMLKIEIFNSSGIPVYYQDLQENYDFRVDLTSTQSGLYIAKITIEGQKEITCKFIIEK